MEGTFNFLFFASFLVWLQLTSMLRRNHALKHCRSMFPFFSSHVNFILQDPQLSFNAGSHTRRCQRMAERVERNVG